MAIWEIWNSPSQRSIFYDDCIVVVITVVYPFTDVLM